MLLGYCIENMLATVASYCTNGLEVYLLLKLYSQLLASGGRSQIEVKVHQVGGDKFSYRP